MIKITRAWLFAVLTLLSGSALAAPCGGFTDVDDAVYGSGINSFCWGVEWVRNRAITIGCTSTTTYCPSDNVNRAQMALFMARLGDRLTPIRQFVDANPGPVNIQGGSYGFVCQSTPVQIPPAGSPFGAFPRTAVVHGLVFGLVSAAVTWGADLWYSVDGGATFTYMSNYIPMNAATAAGGTSGTTFAQADLNVGTTYIFAILVREHPDATTGSGSFTDLGCHMMVEIGNRNGISSPFDAGTVQPAGGLLGGNRAR